MIIKNGSVITPHEVLKADVAVSGNNITQVGKFDFEDSFIIDASGYYVCPGFVDIHTHGGFGGDFMDAEDDAFDKALAFHSQNGTTSILPTSVTAPIEQIEAMLAVVRKYKAKSNAPCKVLGAHVEGPYLSKKNRGAQHEAYLRVPSKDSYDFLIENSDVIKTVTIAPELEGAAKMTASLKKCGITVCGGHDDGEKSLILPVIDAGLSHCTHLWCAMSLVAMRNGVRSIGLCELGLIDDRLSVELIADNHHITPDMVRLVYKCKTADKMCIVSDCLRAGGMPPDGRLYSVGSKHDNSAQRFYVADGVARLPDNSHFAGSIQPLVQMIKNLVFDCNIPLVDAVRAASLTPAKIIGLSDEVGSISAGRCADICLLDKNLDVVKTIVNGRIVYEQ